MSPCFVVPTFGVKYTSTVYLTLDVVATKHRLIAKSLINVLVHSVQTMYPGRYKQHLKHRQPSDCYFNHFIFTVYSCRHYIIVSTRVYQLHNERKH